MLDYVGNFKNKILEPVREVNIRIGFISGNVEYILDSEAVQSHTYRVEIKPELGGVVRKVINMTLMVTPETSLLKRGNSFNLFYCLGDGAECKVDIFFISDIVRNDKQQIIEIDAVDYLTFSKDSPIPFVAMAKNVDLHTYARRVVKAMNMEITYASGVVNPQLKLGYPKSYVLQDTLEEMAFAMNATITTTTNGEFGARLPLIVPFTFNEPSVSDNVFFKVKPFKIGTPVETLTFQNSLIDYKVEDSNEKFDRVSISLFNPSNSAQKALGAVTKSVPAMTTNVNLGTSEFENPCLTQVVHFNQDVDIKSFNIAINRVKLVVDTKDISNEDLTIDFAGLDFATISNFDEAESNSKIINNMYIQSPNLYDSRIYLNDNITINYTGNPLIEVGDTVSIDGLQVLVIEHELKFTGGLRGTMKGVVING